MSKIREIPNEEQITGTGPFDIVKMYEMPSGIGETPTRPVCLYRSHKDEIDAFAQSRQPPSLFVLGILSMSLAQILFAAPTAREWDGLIGACNYAAEVLDDSKWGTLEKVNSWIRKA